MSFGGSAYAQAADIIDPPAQRWRRDPVAWAEERAGIELWSKQREILRSVVDHSNTAVKSAHSCSKTFTAALLTCWWIDVHPVGEARVVTTAPTGKQVDAVLWQEIGKMHRRLDLIGECHVREWVVGRTLLALGRKPPDHAEAAFQGMHARYLLVIFDEAYGVPKKLWDEGSSLASNKYARQLAIGNPDGPGEFMDVCEKDPDWNTIHISYRHTPNFTGESISNSLGEMLISERWVAERRGKWGPKSALFQSKCEGNFPTGGNPYAVIQHDWAIACQRNELPEDPTVCEAGIDVGGGGDRTVIRERRGPRAGREEEFIDSDPMKTVGRLVDKIVEWGINRVKVDSTGLGWALACRLKELSRKHNPTLKATQGEVLHDAEVVPINFGAAAPPGYEKKFLNQRAFIWWQVGRENSRLNAWDLTEVDDDVIHELTTPLHTILDSYGKIKVEPKKDVIKRLGFSPDRAEALLLAFHEVKRSAKAPGSSLFRPSRVDALRAGPNGRMSPGDRLGLVDSSPGDRMGLRER